jgi:hypothetical protein
MLGPGSNGMNGSGSPSHVLNCSSSMRIMRRPRRTLCTTDSRKNSFDSKPMLNSPTGGRIPAKEIMPPMPVAAAESSGRKIISIVERKIKLAVIQTSQDLGYSAEKYPNLTPRAISAQFMQNKVIALFELTLENDEIKVVEQRHYCLVPANSITDEDLQNYANR